MMTRAELAFSALDRDNSGYISNKELRKLSAKLSEEEIRSLMTKVKANSCGGGVVKLTMLTCFSWILMETANLVWRNSKFSLITRKKGRRIKRTLQGRQVLKASHISFIWSAMHWDVEIILLKTSFRRRDLFSKLYSRILWSTKLEKKIPLFRVVMMKKWNSTNKERVVRKNDCKVSQLSHPSNKKIFSMLIFIVFSVRLSDILLSSSLWYFSRSSKPYFNLVHT